MTCAVSANCPASDPGAGRDLFIVIDVPDHPQRRLHMVMPPFLDEEDVTPARTMTGEAALLVRVPLNARSPPDYHARCCQSWKHRRRGIRQITFHASQSS